MGSATPRPPTPAGSTKPHGTSSASGPSSLAVNQCPQNPRQSPCTSATWQLTARPWPPSSRPAPQSPTPMPLRGPRKAITPPAIRSWPKRSRAGGIRRQRPHRRGPGTHPGDRPTSPARPRRTDGEGAAAVSCVLLSIRFCLRGAGSAPAKSRGLIPAP